MSLTNRIDRVQNYLPNELKHALQIFRRRALWKNKGIIFVHIPKAAGISISTALYGRPTGHATANQIRRYAPSLFLRLPSFAITRNPWARSVSAYRFVLATKGQGDGPVAGVLRTEQYQIPAFRSFESFIEEWLVYQDLKRVDYVFRPQLPFVSDNNGKILVSYMGKLEEINLVQKYISQVLGGETNIGHNNRAGAPVSYHCWYTPRLADLISQVYDQDIKAFGYNFD